MINWNDVLLFVKGNLAFPSSFIEKTDEEMKQWLILTALKNFSNYVPDTESTGVSPSSPDYQVLGKTNFYYIFDDEELPILGLTDFYWDGGGDIATGHPYFPATSVTAMKEWALATMQSNMLKPFSFWSYTGKFYSPNMVRVLPTIGVPFGVRYEREQPHDLRRIPNQHAYSFMQLCVAEIKIWIGTLRSQYTMIQTPFGEIPINADVILSDGRELKQQIEDKLQEVTIPNIVIDIE